MNGLIVIDKPEEWTSHDVVRKVKGLLKAKKVGHTGTLDPAATGVLVLCINEATRLAGQITDLSKTYRALISLGNATDTGDREGRVIDSGIVPDLTEPQVREALAQFEGEIEQTVPLYSAVKVRGKKLYQWARQGKASDIVRPRRRVLIDSIKLVSRGPEELEVDVTCSKGTYIRALAEDIGKALGVPAHLAALRRLRQGPYGLDRALTLAELEQAVSGQAAPCDSWLLPCP